MRPDSTSNAPYGAGPTGAPFLFGRTDPAKFLLGTHPGDLPRNAQGVALVGDPQNDSQLFITHNRLVDDLRLVGTPEGALFDEARRLLICHCRWVVANDTPCRPRGARRPRCDPGR